VIRPGLSINLVVILIIHLISSIAQNSAVLNVILEPAMKRAGFRGIGKYDYDEHPGNNSIGSISQLLS
jgi:hypothetical protein